MSRCTPHLGPYGLDPDDPGEPSLEDHGLGSRKTNDAFRLAMAREGRRPQPPKHDDGPPTVPRRIHRAPTFMYSASSSDF